MSSSDHSYIIDIRQISKSLREAIENSPEICGSLTSQNKSGVVKSIVEELTTQIINRINIDGSIISSLRNLPDPLYFEHYSSLNGSVSWSNIKREFTFYAIELYKLLNRYINTNHLEVDYILESTVGDSLIVRAIFI